MFNRLYSETGAFDPIDFKPGLNVILGGYSGAEKGPGINGIGKSTVVRLINLAFLSSSSAKEFKKKKYDFLREHSFTLEFTVNDKPYRIKRSFEALKLAHFAPKDKKLVEYEEAELKTILGDTIFRPVDDNLHFQSQWFRTLMRFYIKDDLENRERKNPIDFVRAGARKAEMLTYNFFLMGIPNESIFAFDSLSRELRVNQSVKNKLEKKLMEETGKDRKEFDRELMEIEGSIQSLEETLEQYRFHRHYKDIEKELVHIAGEVDKKNREYSMYAREFEDYQNSCKVQAPEIDVEKVARLYREVNARFSEFVHREFRQILDFRSELAENREKFLRQRTGELSEKMKKTMGEIVRLDERRRKLLKFLDEKEALDSLKNAYNDLVEQKAKYERVSGNIREIERVDLDISKIKERISAETTQVIQQVQACDALKKSLKTRFYDIISNAVFVDEDTEGVKFDISAESSRKIPADIDIDVPKSTALGHLVFKLLAYDLTVFFHSIHSGRNLPRFLFHDGVFHGVQPKTMINTLNYIYRQSLKHRFQYIVTMNENELFIPEEKENILGKLHFDLPSNIVARFEDRPEKMFFKRSF